MREERSIAEYKVWQNAWKENINEPLIIALLDRWEVEYHNMEGDFWPPLSNEQIRDRIRNPLGSKTVRQLAEEGTEAIIVVDDFRYGLLRSLFWRSFWRVELVRNISVLYALWETTQPLPAQILFGNQVKRLWNSTPYLTIIPMSIV